MPTQILILIDRFNIAIQPRKNSQHHRIHPLHVVHKHEGRFNNLVFCVHITVKYLGKLGKKPLLSVI